MIPTLINTTKPKSLTFKLLGQVNSIFQIYILTCRLMGRGCFDQLILILLDAVHQVEDIKSHEEMGNPS